ncbi:MAG: hypothetical protein O9302_13830 [Cyclobacteriaceae bacterium]|jgi:hypothetical protein|nr:hypothetical protein [Cytophagales bacterium]MCZ8329141.1 hypothetical protein [Cyclobacteriaceae bacterium]
MKLILLLLISLISLGASWENSSKALSPKELSSFIPDKIFGYKKQAKETSRAIKIGNISYSLCEKHYLKEKNEVKVLLFDYADAPIMYTQVMSDREKMIAVDSVYFSPYELVVGKAHQSYNPNQKSAQFFAGINERFFLQISCDNCTQDFLLPVIQSIRYSEFPK